MAILTKLNDKGNIRRTSTADMPYNAQFPILNQYTATSTSSQTVINLTFSIDQTVPESLQLYIDGKLMRQGVGNDYTFTNIDVNNTSSQVTLNFVLSAGLNIIAIKLGFKKESEFNMDNRFVQLYNNMNQSFQGFVDTGTNRIIATTTAGTPAVGFFQSSILGRASLPDLTQDLKPRFGTQRFQVEGLSLLPNELSSTGQPVYSVVNDTFGQMRLVGTGWLFAVNATGGTQIYTGVANDYMEYTFYGTGFNMEVLWGNSGGAVPTLNYSVDGGVTASITWPVNASAVVAGRSVQTNQVIQVVSGLPLGIHTVRVTQTAGSAWNWIVYGVETINQTTPTTNVIVPSGISYNQGKQLTSTSQQSFAYNSMNNTYVFVISTGAGTVGDVYSNNGQTFTVLNYDAVFGFITCSGTGAPLPTGTLIKVSGDPLSTNISYLGFSNKGGRALIYQNPDGTIGNAWQPTTFQLNALTNADHSLEEVSRVYHFREFGASRTDDFSSLSTTRASAFTLDDGTTTLVSDASVVQSVNGRETLIPTASGNFVTITFVGTGLDIVTNSGASVVDGLTVSVDGGLSLGTITGTSSSQRTFRVLSGLAYGTHAVRFARSAAAGTATGITQFIVYQPKKPTLPSGAVELADYNILTPFTQASSPGLERTSQGVIKKSAVREHIYNGTWSVVALSATNDWNGFGLQTTVIGDVCQYTFFGTGFDLRFFSSTGASNSVQMALSFNGGAFTNLTAANFPTAFFSVSAPAGVSFTSATGILNQRVTAGTQAGCSFACQGLPLGTYTVRMTNGVASAMLLNGFDIITPIHSARSNVPYEQQNTLLVGSQGISDNRKFSPIKDSDLQQKNRAQAFGIASTPTTSSTSLVPMPDMSCTLKTEQGFVRATFCGSMNNSTAGSGGFVALYVNGVQFIYNNGNYWQCSATNNVLPLTMSVLVPVSAGTHKFDVYWSASAASTCNVQGTNRNFIVEEI
jgi:hypothetical protein